MTRDGRRLRLLKFLLLAFWAALAVRLGQVQIVRHRYYAARADSLHWTKLVLLGERGKILDRQGRPLALNRLGCSIRILPQYAEAPDSLAALLARYRLGTCAENRQVLRERDRHFWFRRHVDYATADSLRRELVRRRFDNCVVVDDDYRRVYPYGEACASLTGCVGDDAGRAGIEAEFDSLLRGREGWMMLQKAATGRRFPYPSSQVAKPATGADVRLTVDVDVQLAAYAALKEAVTRTQALKGAVVVLDARTGEVLALADYPSFDPHRHWEFPAERYRATAVCDNIEPGSSFKLAICAAALEDPGAAGREGRVFDVSAKFLPIGGYRIHDVHNNGVLSFDSAFVQSSNMACAMMSFSVRPELFHQVVRDLGFTVPTGIGLPGEGTGRLDPPERLNRLRFANVAFGQGVTVTLLQLAAAYLCVANDGRYLKPYLIESVRHGAQVLVRGRRTEVRQALSRTTAERMEDILFRAVDHGTGVRAKIPGVEVCGKTGTAQKCEPGGGYSLTRSRMSFVGFFPRSEPRYVIAVLIDEPQTDRFAGTSACPVFSQVGGQLLDLERMRRTAGRESSPGGRVLMAGGK